MGALHWKVALCNFVLDIGSQAVCAECVLADSCDMHLLNVLVTEADATVLLLAAVVAGQHVTGLHGQQYSGYKMASNWCADSWC